MKYEFKSILGPFMEGLIQEKRAIGYKYESEEKRFREMDGFFFRTGATEPALTKEMVILYTEKRPNETKQTRNGRIGAIRELARYMTRTGNEAYICPPLPAGSYAREYVPHIFTNQELAAIFQAADREGRENKCNQRYAVIFRILYSTGMRVNELMHIKFKDIDFEAGTFFIRQAKNNKDRMIPVHRIALDYLQDYLFKYRQSISGEEYVFTNDMGTSLSSNSVYTHFRRCLWKAGIHHGGRRKGPRVHDFRHTFCVHCLRNWVKEGQDINALMPYLCAYMGHSDTRCTEYYPRLTSELYPDIVAKCERYYEGAGNEE
ncbi:tyrosine-type recombinase/integrase [Erysipelotrichaceae bacterium Oil+RF-744-GAM-WT-6]|uniref:Tyrosine-type recombinase/integrase n=1 Tax=Stecheria intestinalis TaxID=2606630 RepID=A0A7X2NU58_9FIRM|nr:tyrosine-type recombinase/integrase [Stecheria intestinalis]MSS59535.1 tyrosine-type recombinase/integrase [Stecheria intestinalis]